MCPVIKNNRAEKDIGNKPKDEEKISKYLSNTELNDVQKQLVKTMFERFKSYFSIINNSMLESAKCFFIDTDEKEIAYGATARSLKKFDFNYAELKIQTNFIWELINKTLKSSTIIKKDTRLDHLLIYMATYEFSSEEEIKEDFDPEQVVDTHVQRAPEYINTLFMNSIIEAFRDPSCLVAESPVIELEKLLYKPEFRKLAEKVIKNTVSSLLATDITDFDMDNFQGFLQVSEKFDKIFEKLKNIDDFILCILVSFASRANEHLSEESINALHVSSLEKLKGSLNLESLSNTYRNFEKKFTKHTLNARPGEYPKLEDFFDNLNYFIQLSNECTSKGRIIKKEFQNFFTGSTLKNTLRKNGMIDLQEMSIPYRPKPDLVIKEALESFTRFFIEFPELSTSFEEANATKLNNSKSKQEFGS